MIQVDNKFDFAEIVYLLTDVEQKPRMVVEIILFIDGEPEYRLACGDENSVHNAAEISREKNVML